MIKELLYGDGKLKIDLPDNLEISTIEPKKIKGIADPIQAITSSLKSPISSYSLSDRVSSNDKIGIIFNDITRATPNALIIKAILQ